MKTQPGAADRPLRASLKTPIGTLRITESLGVLIDIRFSDGRDSGLSDASPGLERCLRQLEEYFAGRRTAFDLPLEPKGTDFEKRVWAEVLKVPFGETKSYGTIAAALGRAGAARAVGAANGKNPIVVIIPCHRIIGGGGSLVGYGGGLWRKKWLLRHEQQDLKLRG